MIHRGFKIERGHGPPPYHHWDFVHEDYDGPEDGRSGSGADVQDCKDRIDEMIEDEAADEDPLAYVEGWIDR